MRALFVVVLLLLAFPVMTAAQSAAPVHVAAPSAVAAGKYLVSFGACNDCHTPGWRESDGTLDPSKWMVGNTVGFRGPWGTVYPTNVRLWFQAISEDRWLFSVHTRGGHPPMTWHDLRNLSDPDLRAIYRFVRSLGPAGSPAPLAVPPGIEPARPYYDVAPVVPAAAHT